MEDTSEGHCLRYYQNKNTRVNKKIKHTQQKEHKHKHISYNKTKKRSTGSKPSTSERNQIWAEPSKNDNSSPLDPDSTVVPLHTQPPSQESWPWDESRNWTSGIKKSTTCQETTPNLRPNTAAFLHIQREKRRREKTF